MPLNIRNWGSNDLGSDPGSGQNPNLDALSLNYPGFDPFGVTTATGFPSLRPTPPFTDGGSGDNGGSGGGGSNSTIDIGSILGLLWRVLFPPSGSGGNNNGGTSNLLRYLIPILGAVAGGLSNRPQTVSTTSATTPFFPGKSGDLIDPLTQSYMDLISKDPDLSGYQASQTSSINNLADIQKRNTTENLAAKGVTGPAATTAQGGVESQRISGLTSLSESIPLLANQFKLQNLSGAGNFLNNLPVGRTTTGTTQYPGNILGGATGNLTSLLAWLYGLNTQSASPKSGNPSAPATPPFKPPNTFGFGG